jgi:hypothetical protein
MLAYRQLSFWQSAAFYGILLVHFPVSATASDGNLIRHVTHHNHTHESALHITAVLLLLHYTTAICQRQNRGCQGKPQAWLLLGPGGFNGFLRAGALQACLCLAASMSTHLARHLQ